MIYWIFRNTRGRTADGCQKREVPAKSGKLKGQKKATASCHTPNRVYTK